MRTLLYYGLLWAILTTFTVAQPEDEPEVGQQSIEGRLLVPRDAINRGAEILVDGGERVAFFRGDGSFQMHSIPAGAHLLDFNVGNYIFPQVRIDVSRKKRGKIRASISENGKVETVPYPLFLEPRGRAQYFVPREEYSMMSMLKNPMVIMMIVIGVMAFMLPKLADPEQMKEQMQQMGMDSGQPPSLSSLWNQLQEQQHGPEQGRSAKPAAESKKKQ